MEVREQVLKLFVRFWRYVLRELDPCLVLVCKYISTSEGVHKGYCLGMIESGRWQPLLILGR